MAHSQSGGGTLGAHVEQESASCEGTSFPNEAILKKLLEDMITLDNKDAQPQETQILQHDQNHLQQGHQQIYWQQLQDHGPTHANSQAYELQDVLTRLSNYNISNYVQPTPPVTPVVRSSTPGISTTGVIGRTSRSIGINGHHHALNGSQLDSLEQVLTTPRNSSLDSAASRTMSPVYSPPSPATEQIIFKDYVQQQGQMNWNMSPSPNTDWSSSDEVLANSFRTKRNRRAMESTGRFPITPPGSPTSLTGSMHGDQTVNKLMRQLKFQDCQGFPGNAVVGRAYPTTEWDYPGVERRSAQVIIDKVKMNRSRAETSEASCTWSGQLPPRNHKNPIYSCKVFLGGVPWDITESGLQSAFNKYGHLKIEWPGKDGYVYLVFDVEKSVRQLLQSCTHDFTHGDYFYKISSRRMRSKEVQVIPWVLSDSNHNCPNMVHYSQSHRPDSSKTIFVGALHGMITAEALANIMQDLFGTVICAGIDTDKHKYPIGSGRVTFLNRRSYLKAVHAAFVEIKTPKFTKKLQVDPYLGDALCSLCTTQQGSLFCREMICFKYFCISCWNYQHRSSEMLRHRPLSRNTKTPQQ